MCLLRPLCHRVRVRSVVRVGSSCVLTMLASSSLEARRLDTSTSSSSAARTVAGASLWLKVRAMAKSSSQMCLLRPLCHRVRVQSVVRVGPFEKKRCKAKITHTPPYRS